MKFRIIAGVHRFQQVIESVTRGQVLIVISIRRSEQAISLCWDKGGAFVGFHIDYGDLGVIARQVPTGGATPDEETCIVNFSRSFPFQTCPPGFFRNLETDQSHRGLYNHGNERQHPNQEEKAKNFKSKNGGLEALHYANVIIPRSAS